MQNTMRLFQTSENATQMWKLAGTIVASLGIGGLNKLIEPYSGAVYGKVFILVLVILFLQWRPAGLFAMKGRNADS